MFNFHLNIYTYDFKICLIRFEGWTEELESELGLGLGLVLELGI